ncbi:MAG: cytochrome c nitrite reductase small subunit [Phycisphaerales bacterium]|nr:MAG: cytochrome c nitrite reductase small subunit [Phycisphaerales bacterium]
MLARLKCILMLSGLPKRWQAAVYAAGGAVVGLALLVARIGNAASYLSDRPQTCVNCHVMTDAYASWIRGSHGRAAVCNDCHVPHGNPLAKYVFKARDGLKHSYVFTLRKEPQVLELSDGAEPVVRSNCLRCHGRRLVMVRQTEVSERRCWDCHTNIHGRARSLSSSDGVLRPRLPQAGFGGAGKGEKP